MGEHLLKERRSLALLALGLLGVVLALHLPLLQQGGLLGAPQSDVIRGVWGLDHQARGLPLPIWTARVGFPEGVKLLILPWVSSQLAAPLVLLLGAPRAYDLWMLGLLWAAGLSSGLLARQLTGQPWSGWLVGCIVISSPMMLLAITDGTPENVAFWAVPALLLALHRALSQGSLRWGAVAGLLGFICAADSPYHAVFAAGLALLVLPALRRDPRAGLRALGVAGAVALLGVGALALLYVGLPVGTASAENTATNAINLQSWLHWEQGRLTQPWDWTFTPTFIPAAVLVACALAALLSPLRAAPWLLAGAACLLLGLGPSTENPVVLGRLLGHWAVGPAHGWAAIQAAHPMPVIRFLRRFLVPATLCLGLAAELGLARRRPTRWLGPVLGLGLVWVAAAKTGYPSHLPLTHPPVPAAARFVADQPGPGAILLLPRVRAATRLHQRDELPVFADLGAEIQSAAELWLQVQAERPSVNSPNGLLTMEIRRPRTAAETTLLRDLDDLTLPQTVGRPIPPSATVDATRTHEAVQAMVTAGLRYVLVDEAVYGEEGLALLRSFFFDAVLAEERHFDDGTGVTVLVLAPAAR